MLDSYSDNDMNQFNYLNDQINQWLKMSIVTKLNNTTLPVYNGDTYRKNVESQLSNVNDNLKNLFINVNSTSEKNATVKSQNFSNYSASYSEDTVFTQSQIKKITLDSNYRLVFISDTIIGGLYYETNYRYSDTYLKNPEIQSSFYPSVNLAEIVPLLYLESCTSVIPTFLKRFFNMSDVNTVDEINRRCMTVDHITSMNTACGIEKNNIRCACQPCYSKHSNQSRQIGKILSKSNAVSNNPWCIYPSCASGMAFKNSLLQKRSACSNISVAGIFLNPSEYSNINISNTTVSASSANENGINLYGDGNCAEGEEFVVDNVGKKITCVKKEKSVKSLGSLKDVNEPNDKKLHWSFWFIIASVILTIILSLFYIFTNIPITYMRYLLKIIFCCITISIFFIIYYSIILTRESYSTCNELSDKICYSDIECDTTGNFNCLDNECKCGIGFFDIRTNNALSCGIYPSSDITSILTNFPYLPSSVFGGVYYFSTVIDGDIYVFSTDANFKYDGNKWQELIGFESQKGFHPYEPYPPFYIDTNINDKLVFLNTNMSYTYKNKVYIVTLSNTIIKNNNTTYDKIYVYDTINNIWSYYNPKEFLYFITPRTICILDDLMYTFGNKTTIKITNFDTNTNTYKNTVGYTFGNYLHSFVYNNKIYVCGMYTSNSPLNGYSIFEYNPDKNAFNLIVTLGAADTNFIKSAEISGFTGGVLTGFVDNMFYIITNSLNINRMYYYDFKLNYVSSVPINMPTGTTIFVYPVPDNLMTKLIYKYSKGNTIFHKNGFAFIITGSGEIFRGYFNKNTDGTIINFNINPCLGVSNYGQPINNRIVQI
jgi:hypothetical protein